eukprot:2391875-Amphidinium_carterae.1
MPTGTTSATLKNGKEVCAAWNKGQCKEPCPQSKLHVCNAVIGKNGRVCAMSNHTAGRCRRALGAHS